MTALTHQRTELTGEIVEKWQIAYTKKPAIQRHDMLTALLRAYARQLPVYKLKSWLELIESDQSKS